MDTKTIAPADARAKRGLELWCAHGDQIRVMPNGGLSVPSGDGQRSYRVQLMDPMRCGCRDFERRRDTCKHLYAAIIWHAKMSATLARISEL